MRVHRKYKVSDDSGLVGVSVCSAGLSGSIQRVSDVEYNMIRVAACLKNAEGEIDTSLLPVETVNGVYLEEVTTE